MTDSHCAMPSVKHKTSLIIIYIIRRHGKSFTICTEDEQVILLDRWLPMFQMVVLTPYSTATSNIGQKCNGPECHTNHTGRDR